VSTFDMVFYFQASRSNIQPSHVRRKEISFVTISEYLLNKQLNVAL